MTGINEPAKPSRALETTADAPPPQGATAPARRAHRHTGAHRHSTFVRRPRRAPIGASRLPRTSYALDTHYPDPLGHPDSRAEPRTTPSRPTVCVSVTIRVPAVTVHVHICQSLLETNKTQTLPSSPRPTLSDGHQPKRSERVKQGERRVDLNPPRLGGCSIVVRVLVVPVVPPLPPSNERHEGMLHR